MFLVVLTSQTPENQRWPESHFQTPTPLLFQNFKIRTWVRKHFNLENLTSVHTPVAINATEIQQWFYLRNGMYKDHADFCYCRKGQSDSGHCC